MQCVDSRGCGQCGAPQEAQSESPGAHVVGLRTRAARWASRTASPAKAGSRASSSSSSARAGAVDRGGRRDGGRQATCVRGERSVGESAPVASMRLAKGRDVCGTFHFALICT